MAFHATSLVLKEAAEVSPASLRSAVTSAAVQIISNLERKKEKKVIKNLLICKHWSPSTAITYKAQALTRPRCWVEEPGRR